jgi:ATP-dependent Clp protease protease subunit
MEEKTMELRDANGNIVSKEEFLEQAAAIYDEAMAAQCECSKESADYITILQEESVDPEEVNASSDFYRRIIYLAEEIEHGTGTAICSAINLWNAADDFDNIPVEEREPIKLIINTPGGDLAASLAIIDAIELSKTPVFTYTIGTGYSGGFFIGICGHKRFGYPHSSYCFHEGGASDSGDAHKLLQRIEFYKKQLGILKDITINHTYIDDEIYKKRQKDDWFMTAQEALEYGVIDKISTELINY